MRENDPKFTLPKSFFESEVIGVPGGEQSEIMYIAENQETPKFSGVQRLLQQIMSALNRLQQQILRRRPASSTSHKKSSGFWSGGEMQV